VLSIISRKVAFSVFVLAVFLLFSKFTEATYIITSPDTIGDVGNYASLQLDSNGYPIISYYDSTNGDLRILHCGDSICLSGNIVTSPDTFGDVGYYTSMQLDSNGHPIVSYYDVTNGDIKLLRCGDTTCSSGNTITSPDTVGNVGGYASLQLDSNGYPVISYLDYTNGDLKVLHCGNVMCSGGNVIISPDTANNVGHSTSLKLDSNGYPVISYLDYTNFDLKIIHCGDTTCSSGNTITSPDTIGNVGQGTGLQLDSNGNPVVSYYDITNGDLKIIHCGDTTCSSGNTITSPDTTGDVGVDTSLRLDANGIPVVSYLDYTNGNLKVLHCGNTTCSSGNTVVSPDALGNIGWHVSMQLDSNGNPVIGYYNYTNGDLKVLRCNNAVCSRGSNMSSDSVDSFKPHASLQRNSDFIVSKSITDKYRSTSASVSGTSTSPSDYNSDSDSTDSDISRESVFSTKLESASASLSAFSGESL